MRQDEGIDEREVVASQNRQALTDLMQKYQITLPNRSFDQWRPTVPTGGWINGLWSLGELTCLATDGMVGVFVNAEDKPEVYHVRHFIWSAPTKEVIRIVDPANGQTKLVVATREQGAPPPLYSNRQRAHRDTASAPKVAKKPLSKRQQVLADL